MLKKIFFIVYITVLSASSFAQNLTSMQGGGSTKASVSESIGITEVTIQYARPL